MRSTMRGYSDDPLYTFRILAAAKDPIMKQALWQYQHWPPDRHAALMPRGHAVPVGSPGSRGKASGKGNKAGPHGGILMRQIRQLLFCFSILLVTLFVLFNRMPARAAETHVSCPQGGFVIDDTLSDKAGIPGTDMTIET